MTVTRIEAIYQNGVLKLLEDPGLVENQRVLIEIQTEPQEHDSSAVTAWHRVYEGLSEEEIAEIESIVLG
jgi:predicted DNA-binding antitoxin AbrB/MazE fold protein